MAKVYGPYLHKKNQRQYVILQFADGTRRSTAYARWLMMQQLDRELVQDETVDHVNEDATDDSIENLQILPHAENIRKSHRRMEWFEFTCPICGSAATKPAGKVRHNLKQGKAGPFCGKQCSRAWQVQRQALVSQSVEEPPSSRGQ